MQIKIFFLAALTSVGLVTAAATTKSPGTTFPQKNGFPCGTARLNGTLSIDGPRTIKSNVAFISGYGLTNASRDAGVSANAAYHAGNNLVITSYGPQLPTVFEAWDCSSTSDQPTKPKVADPFETISFVGQIYHAGACLTRVLVENVTFVARASCLQPLSKLDFSTLPSNQSFTFRQTPGNAGKWGVNVPTTAARYWDRGREDLPAVTLSAQNLGQSGLVFNA